MPKQINAKSPDQRKIQDFEKRIKRIKRIELEKEIIKFIGMNADRLGKILPSK